MPNDASRLTNPFRADRERVQAATKDITRQQKPQVISEELFARINCRVRDSPKIAGQFFDSHQLTRIKTARIYRNGVNLPLLLAQPKQAERSVETSAEGEKGFHFQSKRRSVVVVRLLRRSRIHASLFASSAPISSSPRLMAAPASFVAVNEPS